MLQLATNSPPWHAILVHPARGWAPIELRDCWPPAAAVSVVGWDASELVMLAFQKLGQWELVAVVVSLVLLELALEVLVELLRKTHWEHWVVLVV